MSSEIEILTGEIAGAKEITPAVIDAMNSLAALQLDKDVPAAAVTALGAVEAARSIQYTRGESAALLQAGLAATRQRNYVLAVEYYGQALPLLEKARDIEGVAEVQKKLGNVKYYQGQYPEAIDHYNRAIELRIMMGDEPGAADLYSNSGVMFGLLGNYAQALKSHLQALKIYEGRNDLSKIATSLSNIGIVYYEQQNYEEALSIYQRALDIRKQTNNDTELSILMNNIGLVYHDQKKYTEALRMHEETLVLRKRIGDKSRIALSASNLADVYKATGNYNVALEFYTQARALFEEINDRRGLVSAYFNIGELYFLQGNTGEAKNYLDNAVTIAESIGLKEHLREAYEYMAKICAGNKEFEEAYRLNTRVITLDREILNSETSRMVAQINMRHEIEQNERKAEFERIKNEELTKAYASLEEEKKRSEELLLNILPEEVSEELKLYGKTKARSYATATVLFADIKGFTIISEQLTAEELVTGIDEYFEAFDRIVEKYGIEKIKTIGDAYLCAGGLPVADNEHAIKVVAVAKEFLQAAETLKQKRGQENLHTFDFRIGIHTGPVVAGVVGIKKFAYDIWGDTVNTASRMQQNSDPGRINISDSTYQLVKSRFACESRGEVEAKNKGWLKMYFVN